MARLKQTQQFVDFDQQSCREPSSSESQKECKGKSAQTVQKLGLMSPQSLPPSVCSPQLLSSHVDDPDCNSAFTLTVVQEETTKNEASLAKHSSNFFEDFRLESRAPELPSSSSLEQTILNESGYDASANQSLEQTKKLISDFKEPREVVSIEQIW